MQKPEKTWFDIPSILLLAIATLIASARLVVTEWLPDLELIAGLTRLGLLLGLVLGYSRFQKTWRGILTLGYSLTLIPWQIFLSISPLLSHEERIYEMGTRFQTALATFSAREAVDDPLLVLVLLGILFWSAALYGNFALLRHQNGLAALLPSMLIILSVQYNDHQLETPLWLVGFYFFFAFLLLARLDYLANYKKWKEKNFFIVPDVKIDFHIFSIVAISVLLLFTWNLPSSDAEWKNIARWWDKTTYRFKFARENLDNLFSAVDNPAQARSRVLYGTSLSLGERSYQGTNAIAVVDVPEPESIENPPPRYYWRVRSYDTYSNGGWSSVEGKITELLPAQNPLLIPVDPESETAKFIFTNKADQRVNLLIPAQSYWADINTLATYTELPDSALDLSLLRATETLRTDDVYTVQAALLAPTVAELRAAGTEYPDWITERFLQLPEDFPASISKLARDITRGRSSSYDKARAITLYLRTEIEYADNIPTPPAGRDPLEWFLFTWQEGYCNYSASAQVVMLRSLGIPARLVVGFAQGQRVEDGNYAIIQKDAHAWPEVYFPEIGWVEFEPTGNQTRLIRPLGEIEVDQNDEGILQSGLIEDELLDNEPALTPEPELPKQPEALDIEENGQKAGMQAIFWGMIVLFVGAALFGIWQLNRKQAYLTRALRQVVRVYEQNDRSIPKWISRWLAWLEARDMERAFHAINRALKWLSGEIPPHLTPRERAEMLTELLPAERDIIMQLADEHQKTLFSPEDGDIEIAQDASKRIIWAALQQRLKQRSDQTGS